MCGFIGHGRTEADASATHFPKGWCAQGWRTLQTCVKTGDKTLLYAYIAYICFEKAQVSVWGGTSVSAGIKNVEIIDSP